MDICLGSDIVEFAALRDAEDLSINTRRLLVTHREETVVRHFSGKPKTNPFFSMGELSLGSGDRYKSRPTRHSLSAATSTLLFEPSRVLFVVMVGFVFLTPKRDSSISQNQTSIETIPERKTIDSFGIQFK